MGKPRGRFVPRFTSFRFFCVGNWIVVAKREFEWSLTIRVWGSPRQVCVTLHFISLILGEIKFMFADGDCLTI